MTLEHALWFLLVLALVFYAGFRLGRYREWRRMTTNVPTILPTARTTAPWQAQRNLTNPDL